MAKHENDPRRDDAGMTDAEREFLHEQYGTELRRLFDDSGLNAKGAKMIRRHENRPVLHRRLGILAVCVTGTTLVGAVAWGIAKSGPDERMPRSYDALGKIEEKILQDPDALRQTGSCEPELRAEAALATWFARKHGDILSDDHKDRAAHYAAAADLAKQQQIPCAPADNKAPYYTYTLSEGGRAVSLKIDPDDITRFTVMDDWCDSDLRRALTSREARTAPGPRAEYDREFVKMEDHLHGADDTACGTSTTD